MPRSESYIGLPPTVHVCLRSPRSEKMPVTTLAIRTRNQPSAPAQVDSNLQKGTLQPVPEYQNGIEYP